MGSCTLTMQELLEKKEFELKKAGMGNHEDLFAERNHQNSKTNETRSLGSGSLRFNFIISISAWAGSAMIALLFWRYG